MQTRRAPGKDAPVATAEPLPVDEANTDGAAPTRRYGGLTPDERRADRRRRLLDTALELFATEGYANIGISRLCSQAGVTARHFYEEFGSRENLMLELVKEVNLAAGAAVAQALQDAPLDLKTYAHEGLGALIHFMLDDPRRARVTSIECVGVSPELDAYRRQLGLWYRDMTYAQVERLAGAGQEVSTEPTHYVIRALVGGCNEAMVAWLEDPDHPPIDVLIAEMVQLFIAAGAIPPKSQW